MIKVLGVFIGFWDLDVANWHPRLDSVSKCLLSWSSRSLSLHGKAMVDNALVLSRIWYMASMVMPNWVVKELNSIEEQQTPSQQNISSVSQGSIPTSKLPPESEDDFKSIEEDPMSNASTEDSTSESEEPSVEQPVNKDNHPTMSEPLLQQSGARKPAKIPDVKIPLRHLHN